MPAELADGLGLGSDLGAGYPVPCAPSTGTRVLVEFGSPARLRRKAKPLRLLQTGDESHPWHFLSSDMGTILSGKTPP